MAKLEYRKFLSQFKTKPCPLHDHPGELCPYFHPSAWPKQSVGEGQDYHLKFQYRIMSEDKRRNPYGKLNRILYKAQYCDKIVNGCQNQQCEGCHNIWEYSYHPLVFKTNDCPNFYECGYQFCDKVHYSDYTVNPKLQSHVLRFS